MSTAILGNWLVESGVNARPHLGPPLGVHARTRNIHDHMQVISRRLRTVRVICGDWSRTVSSITERMGITGILLDPPYLHSVNRDRRLYQEESATVADHVRKWAIDNQNHPLLRIALCGYEGEHAMPSAWECVEWKAGGMDRIGDGNGADNVARERIWFSPHCLGGKQGSLF